MADPLTTSDRLASDIIALTALPSRWIGAAPERIADDVAATLYHLCDELEAVEVRVELPPSTSVRAARPPGRATAPPRDGLLVSATNEAVVPIGQFGRHGDVLLVARRDASIARPRLLAIIAANEVEAACRALASSRTSRKRTAASPRSGSSARSASSWGASRTRSARR